MPALLIIAAIAAYLLVGFVLAYIVWKNGPEDEFPILAFVPIWPGVIVAAILWWLGCEAETQVHDLFREIGRGRRNRK